MKYIIRQWTNVEKDEEGNVKEITNHTAFRSEATVGYESETIEARAKKEKKKRTKK